MNQQLNSRDQHGDLNWATKSWDSSNTSGELEIGPYQESRVDHWDWDQNPMIVTQNAAGAGAGAGECSDHGYEDHKPQFLSGLMAPSMKPYSGLLSTNFGSAFHHSNIGLMEPIGIQPFGGLDFTSHSLANPPALIPENYGFSNFPGLPAANISQTSDFRFLDQQRRNRLLGSLGTDHKSPTDFIKPNDMYSAESHARIGLNLGFRTYFSSEDTIFGRLGKRPRANSPGSLQVPMCQAEGCKADLSNAKHYHRRHKVCELHSKAAIVVTNGQNQRFCQQCSRFQPLSEFDEGKRSCRKRLADHNRRRRKPQPTASSSTTAEPLPLKAEEQEQASKSDSPGAAEGKSVIENLKKGSSPSGSLENSGSKTTSVGDKVQFRASSRYNPPADQSPSELFSSHSPALLASDHYESFSVSQPMSLLIRSDNGSKVPALGSSCQPHGLIRATGLTLSSAAIREGQLASNCQGESSSCHNYNIAATNTFPWLKPSTPAAKLADHFTSSATRSHDQIIHESNGLNSIATTRSAECQSGIPAFCPSIQNLLPFQSSRDIEHSDWILKNITRKTKPQSQSQSSQFKPSSLNCQGSFENSQGLPFLGCPSIRAEVQRSRTPVEFLQKNSTMGSVNSDEGEDAPGQIAELKFPELQTLRPFGSVYDPNINFL